MQFLSYVYVQFHVVTENSFTPSGLVHTSNKETTPYVWWSLLEDVKNNGKLLTVRLKCGLSRLSEQLSEVVV